MEHWPRPKSGRHDVRKWIEFIVRFGLKCADEAIKPEDLPKERWTIREWKEHREKLMCEKIQFEIENEKKKHVPLDEICAAVGQMLAGFRTAINMLPGSAARWLIGLKDFHAIKSKLESEVEGVLQSLGGAANTSSSSPADKCAPHFIELGKESLKELQIDVGHH